MSDFDNEMFRLSGKLLKEIEDETRKDERDRVIGIMTALWGADLVTTQQAMRGEITMEYALDWPKRKWVKPE